MSLSFLALKKLLEPWTGVWICYQCFCYYDGRQQDLLKKVVEVKPKRPKISTPSTPSLSPPIRSDRGSTDAKVNTVLNKQDRPKEQPGADPNDGKGTESKGQGNASSKGLLGLAYDSSDDEDWEELWRFYLPFSLLAFCFVVMSENWQGFVALGFKTACTCCNCWNQTGFLELKTEDRMNMIYKTIRFQCYVHEEICE